MLFIILQLKNFNLNLQINKFQKTADQKYAR